MNADFIPRYCVFDTGTFSPEFKNCGVSFRAALSPFLSRPKQRSLIRSAISVKKNPHERSQMILKSFLSNVAHQFGSIAATICDRSDACLVVPKRTPTPRLKPSRIT